MEHKSIFRCSVYIEEVLIHTSIWSHMKWIFLANFRLFSTINTIILQSVCKENKQNVYETVFFLLRMYHYILIMCIFARTSFE